MQDCETQTFHYNDDGTIPNSSLPLILFRQCIAESEEEARKTLAQNKWGGIWINGIYDYHHYHSTAHELLAILDGNARVQVGGENGDSFEITRGDVMIIPAGVGHKLLYGGPALKVLGAYPNGQEWDLRKGEPGDRPQVIENIKAVPLPEMDPIYGRDGALMQLWRQRNDE